VLDIIKYFICKIHFYLLNDKNYFYKIIYKNLGEIWLMTLIEIIKSRGVFNIETLLQKVLILPLIYIISLYKLQIFPFSFGWTGVWTQGLTPASQVLSYLSHAPARFWFSYFLVKVPDCLVLALNFDLLNCTSHIAGIMSMCRDGWPSHFSWQRLLTCLLTFSSTFIFNTFIIMNFLFS
jgi:hypothetical protein